MEKESKVDPRLAKAVQAGQKAKNAAQNAAAKKREAEAKKEKKRIASFSKKAKEWVDNELFKLIAKAEAEGSDRVPFYGSGIPDEALLKAIKKVEGLRIESVWVQEYRGSDGYPDELAHYNYYVKWKSDPYAGYKF